MRKLIYVLTLFVLYLPSLAENKLPINGKAAFVVSAPSCNERDTLELRIWDTYIGEVALVPNPHRVFKSGNVDGKYYFEIEGIKDIAWISLNLSYQKSRERALFGILKLYIVEPGDSIQIFLNPRKGENSFGHYDDGTPVVKKNWDISFSGHGSGKYKARWEVDELILDQENPYKFSDPVWAIHQTEINKGRLAKRLETIGKYKATMSSEVWEQLVVDLEGQYRRESLDAFRGVFQSTPYDKVLHRPIVEMLYGELSFIEKDKSQKVLCHIGKSGDYLRSLFTYVELINHIEGSVNRFNAYCETAQSILSNPTIRDRVLTQIVLLHHKRSVEKTNLKDIFASLQDTACINMVAPFLHTLDGAESFAFNLPDQNGKWHKMSDYRNKVVLIDFWFGACVPCRVYMQEVLLPLAEKYKDNPDVQVITISIDPKDLFTRAVSESDYLPQIGLHLFTADERTKHPVIQYYGVSGYPFPVLIDKSGKVSVSGKALKTIDGLEKAIEKLL